VFPFGLAPELKELLEERWAWREGLFVFHRDGARIGSFRYVWARACKKAGLEGRLVHDLRRTAARDFRRRGVSEGETMKLCGWKTRAMFDRYNIIDEADLAEAVAKRFQSPNRQTKGQKQANIGTPTTLPSPLSSSAA
jgi:integrase